MAQNSSNRGGGNQGGGNQGGNQGGRGNNERGFAAMDENTQRKIAQKGGEAVSRDRQHMSEIGKKGGESSGGGNRGGGNQGGGNNR